MKIIVVGAGIGAPNSIEAGRRVESAREDAAGTSVRLADGAVGHRRRHQVRRTAVRAGQ